MAKVKLDKKKAQAITKSLEQAAKNKHMKAKGKWRGLLPKIHKISKGLDALNTVDDGKWKKWSHAYNTLETYAVSDADKKKFFNVDMKNKTFDLSIQSFKDFEKLSEGEQTKFKEMVDKAAEYKTMTVKGAQMRSKKSFESFKKNREIKKDINPDTGEVIRNKRRPILSREKYDNFWTVYNKMKEKDKDKFGSAMIDMIQDNLNIEAMTNADIEKILDYAYNEAYDQYDKGTGIEGISVSYAGLDEELLKKYFW